MVVTVAVIVMMMTARTGRIGRHSTTGLAGVPAARLALAQLDQRVGHSQPQLDAKRRVVGRPVREHRPGTWPRPALLITLCHSANTTRLTLAKPVIETFDNTRPRRVSESFPFS